MIAPVWLAILADVAAICAAVAVLVTTVFVWRQVRLQAAGQDNDTKRFMRESISLLNETLQDEQFRIDRKALFGSDITTYSNLSETQKGQARAILNRYGMLTRMVQAHAIDEDLFRNFWRAAFLRDWERLGPFVQGERLNTKNPALFGPTQALAQKWIALDAD